MAVSLVRSLIVTSALVWAATYWTRPRKDESNANRSDYGSNLPGSVSGFTAVEITDTEKDQVYDSLEIDKDSILVIHLFPAAASELVRCEVSVIKLSDDYEALSWVWEDLPGNESILVNGKRWRIRANLVAALKALREGPRGKARIIWTDALCANQKNKDEMNREVPRMRDIYSQAEKVVLWLGVPTTRSDQVLDFFIARLPDRGPYSRLLATYKTHEHMWLAFGEELLERPFWSRLWIVQELVSAKEAIVQCGSRTMPWKRFYYIPWLAMNHHLRLHVFQNVYSTSRRLEDSIHVLEGLRSTIVFGEQVDLMGLLSALTEFNTSDPRDFVYALLGLSHNRNDPDLRPNYNYSCVRVWTEMTWSIVRKSGRVDFITLGHAPDRDPSLSSLVPDFRLDYALQAVPLPLNYRTTPRYNAAGGKPFVEKVFSWFEGFVLDEMLAMGQAVDSHRSPESEFDDLLVEIMNEAADMAFGGQLRPKMHAKYLYTGESNYRACSRTLVCDLHWGGERCIGDQGFLENINSVPLDFQPEAPKYMRVKMWTTRNVLWKIAHLNHRRFMSTKVGNYMGMVPEDTEVGDKIVVLWGATAPVILRPVVESTNEYRLIGACYVHGVMDGEAVEMFSDREQEFFLA